jgi:two-component system KDP operon response regulator KdpE
MSTVKTQVLLVEDEPQMRRFLRASLGSHGYALVEAETSREGLQLATSHNPQLILLDLGLPDGDGLDLVKQIREWSQVPIIVLSARGREEDKVNALDAGADDYLTKPFGVAELLARIRVALRHLEREKGGDTDPIIRLANLQIDVARHQVSVSEKEIRLTPIEFNLLLLLAKNAGKVLTHRQILKEIWGPGATQAHYVRVHMAELRKKIEADPARPQILLTEPGVGYRLREP